MFKKIFLIIFAFYIFSVECKSLIKEIYSMREAYDILAQADEHTVVLFDVDETLIFPIDKIHLPQFFSVNPGKALKEAFEQKVADLIEDIWSIVLHQAIRKLIEPEIVALINTLLERNVITLGFTKMRSGRFGPINSLAEYRFNQLKMMGIEFWPSYKQSIIFNQFVCHFDGSPLLYKGIIYTNELSKGPILGAFLDCLDKNITQVIFFDDSLANIISVQEELSKRNIIYYGYHYRAIEKIIKDELDCTIVQFQLDYLYDHKIWLSEEEAYRLLSIHQPLQEICDCQ